MRSADGVGEENSRDVQILREGMSLANLVVGFLLSLLIAAASVRVQFLTTGGAAAAVVIGTLTLGFGGWGFAVLLGIFFVTSSILTRWRRAGKTRAEPHTARTALQVLANGGVAAGAAVTWAFSHSEITTAAFAAAVAAATADTWATEVGLLSPSPPRLITSWQVVTAGISGGVTPLGTAAAVAGAGFIAWSARLLGVPAWIPWLTGIAAMLLDSVLGATAEGRRAWVTNDTVNALATLFAAAAGAAVALIR